MVGRKLPTPRGMRAVLAAVAMTTAACSGGGSAADPTTTTAVTVPATEAPTTTVPDTTVASTVAPSTAPPTTLDPAAQLAAEVEADFREANDLLNEALMDPTNDAKVQAALDARTGFARESLEAEIQRYRDGNLAIRESETVQPVLIIEQPATLIPPSSDVVELVRCEVDPWVVVEVGAGPQGSDALVNDEVYARRSTIFLRLVDGRWKIEGGNREAEWVGVTECPPA